MTDKLACIILDALDPYNMRQLGLEYIQSLYNDPDLNSGLMATSGKAHTPISNALIWGGYTNTEKIWVETHPHRWAGGVGDFDPTLKEYGDGKPYSRGDFDTSFIWDVLDHHGYQVSALGIPICLPPYSFNEEDRLEEAWFPHTREHLKTHVRRKPEIIRQHINRGDDFICSSIKVPDQWLHAQGSGIVDKSFVEGEALVLDSEMEKTISLLESEEYDWLVFGDHGSPTSGRTTEHGSKKMLARHRKETAITGTINPPKYTSNMFSVILSFYEVDNVDIDIGTEKEVTVENDVKYRLKSLGYVE